MDKQKIKITLANGAEYTYDSILEFSGVWGYSYVGALKAVKRGHAKNFKIEKIDDDEKTVTVSAKDGSFENTYKI